MSRASGGNRRTAAARSRNARTASASSNAPAWDTSPLPSADTVILARRGTLHLNAFGSARTGPSTSPVLSGHRHFLYAKQMPGESPGLGRLPVTVTKTT
jgi:hypothetical protein